MAEEKINKVQKKNILDLTRDACKIHNESENDIISISIIYRHKKNNNRKKNDFTIKGLNIQLYNHELMIIPNIREMDQCLRYSTSDDDARAGIAYDLVNNRKFTKEDAAKLMKCSLSSLNYLLGISKSKEDKIK